MFGSFSSWSCPRYWSNKTCLKRQPRVYRVPSNSNEKTSGFTLEIDLKEVLEVGTVG